MFEIEFRDPGPTHNVIRYRVDRGEAEAEMCAPFRHRPEGYEHKPAYKRGQHDGYMCPINRIFKTIPKGIFKMVYDSLKDNPEWDLDVSGIQDQTLLSDVESVTREDLMTFLAGLKPQRYDPGLKQYEEIGFHPHQVEMIYHSINRRRMVAESATSSGKSLSMWATAKFFLERLNQLKQRVLIIVPSLNLIGQLATEFTDYSAGGPFRHNIRQIFAGQTHDPDFRQELVVVEFPNGNKIWAAHEKIQLEGGAYIIAGQLLAGIHTTLEHGTPKSIKKILYKPLVVISTWQSLLKSTKHWFDQMNFGMVMVDEAHGSKADGLTKILRQIETATYRIGCTGTLHNEQDQCSRLAVIANLGPPVPIIRTRELIDKGMACQLEIIACCLKYPIHVRKRFNYPGHHKGDGFGTKFNNEKEYLLNQCPERQRFIARLAIAMKYDVLILSDRLENLRQIEALIKELAPTKPVFMITGKTERIEREEIRQKMGSDEPTVLIGIVQIVSTGISIPSLGGIIGVNLGESMIRVVQTLGRGIRKSTGKEKCLYFAIADDLRRVSRNGTESNNYLWEHFLKQLEYFAAEEHPVSFKEIQLKGDFVLPERD